MTLIKVTSKGYTFKRGRGSITLPRVSRILDWKYGPMKGDPERLKWLARFGTMVHESIDRKRPLPGTEGHVEQARKFLSDGGWKTLKVEFPVWCLSQGYAGRSDRLVKNEKGQTALVDWKTGAVTDRSKLAVNFYSFAMLSDKEDVSGHWLVQLMERTYRAQWVPKYWEPVLRICEEYKISQEGQS